MAASRSWWGPVASARQLRFWMASAAGLGVLLGLRYGIIEAGRLPLACGGVWEAGQSAVCMAKWALINLFIDQRVGLLSLGCGGLALLLNNRPLALIGWAAGLAGLVLYSFDPVAVGALTALLTIVRTWRQPQAQSQPQAER